MSAEDIRAVVRIVEKYFPDARADEGEIRRRIANGYRYFVAVQNESVLGFVDVKLRERSAFLGGIAVVPGAEGHGIGTLLLKEAIEFAKRNGKTAVELVVKESNDRAVRFYTKNGFAVKKVKPGKSGGVLVLLRELEN